MSDYKKVSDALEAGAEPEMLCQTCPWDRHCILPPEMTAQDIREQEAKAKADDDAKAEAARQRGENPPMPMGMLINAIALGGKDRSAQVCPVFALRLRTSEGEVLVRGLKSQMQAASVAS